LKKGQILANGAATSKEYSMGAKKKKTPKLVV